MLNALKQQKFTALLALAATLVFSPLQAFAINSCPDAESLQECLDMNVETCREEANCSGDREQALTTTDIVDFVTERCCAKARSESCLKRNKRKLRRGIRPGHFYLRRFIRQSVSEVKEIDCSTNSQL